MRTHVNRRTVDLSGYPDLVVVYLGMRVNRITGIKTLLGFGPRFHHQPRRNRKDFCTTKRSFTPFSRCILVFANIGVTSSLSFPGLGPTRTGDGGRTFLGIRAEPGFGTRLIFDAGASRQFMAMYRALSA